MRLWMMRRQFAKRVVCKRVDLNQGRDQTTFKRRAKLLVQGNLEERGENMLSWLIIGVVSWVLGFGFVWALMIMAGDQDRGARHQEKLLMPFSDVTVTQFGNS